MRWLVGDVQGCARELDRLLSEIRFDPGRDELWCLGDLVNRGPDSAAAVRLWRDVGGRGILGNHDVNALLARAGLRSVKPSDTLQDLFEAPDADELLGQLGRLPVLVHLEPPVAGAPDVWIVHAGLHPAWIDLERVAGEIEGSRHEPDWLLSPAVKFATRVRCCTADGRMSRNAGPPSECRPPYRPWDDFYGGDALVVHGHWALRGFYQGARTLGLDSGCVYGGGLTAWCHEEQRIVRVPSEAPLASG